MSYHRPEEDQSIWSKRRQGFQPCCEAGIREPTLSDDMLLVNKILANAQHCIASVLTCAVASNAGVLCSSSTLLKMSATTYSVTSKHSVVHPHCIV